MTRQWVAGFATRQHTSPHRQASPHKQRGSVMLLTIVALLMIAMVGMSYLQISRLDRAAASQTSRTNIDIVAGAITAYIGEVLQRDLVDPNGNFFAKASGIEPYDYPWTNPDANVQFKVTLVDGKTKKAIGGSLDDTWLAATEPDFSGNNPIWPHLTNLNGIYLELPKPYHNKQSKKSQPKESVIDNKNDDSADTDVPIQGKKSLTETKNDYEQRGADADGDGIVDSRWTWAPLRQMGGISYVMAVRIIDNSALLNANVALSQVRDKDQFDTSNTGSNAPRWAYPSELDLGNFVFKSGGSIAELQAFLQYRLGTLTTPDLPLAWIGPTASRNNFWLTGPSLFGNYNGADLGFPTYFRKLGITNELELRFHNGLNNHNVTTRIESTNDGLGKLLRANAKSETDYQDIPGISSIQDFYEKEPRHQLTLFSGAAIFAPPLPTETGLIAKRDLNRLCQTPDLLEANIKSVFSAGDRPDLPRGLNTPQELADQLTANLIDYMDADNRLTAHHGRFGHELLPVITEVYTHRPYTIKSAKQSNVSPQRWQDTILTAGSQHQPGYAIEIRNPYTQPISLSHVHLYVGSHQLTNGQTRRNVDLDTLAGDALAKANHGSRKLLPHQALILYHNSSAPGSRKKHHNVADLFQDDSPSNVTSPIKVEISDQPLLSTTIAPSKMQTADISFELRAEDEQATELTWPYCRVMGKQFLTNTAPEINFGIIRTKSSDPTKETVFIQYSRFANSQGLNALAYPSDQMLLNKTRNYYQTADLSTGGAPLFISVYDRLGLEDKSKKQTQKNLAGANNQSYTISGFTGQKFDPKTNQWLISNQGRFVSVGEIAHVAAVGASPTATLADALGSGSILDMRDYMLDIHSTQLVVPNDPTDALALPHALVLLSRLTTLSPDEDNLDNDGDGQDTNNNGFHDTHIDNTDLEGDELFVPGQLNINTATAKLLNTALPLPDTNLRAKIIENILAYRDQQKPYDKTGRHVGGNYRDMPGIAVLGELYNADDDQILKGGTNTLADNSQDDDTMKKTVIDFLANPDANTADDIQDDREEETLICRNLQQVLTTRSDIFTAYIYIRGYPAGDFRLGPVQSKRMLVVFDRSGVVNQNTPARILGLYELN